MGPKHGLTLEAVAKYEQLNPESKTNQKAAVAEMKAQHKPKGRGRRR